jgi:hypothetical protein
MGNGTAGIPGMVSGPLAPGREWRSLLGLAVLVVSIGKAKTQVAISLEYSLLNIIKSCHCVVVNSCIKWDISFLFHALNI